MTFADREGLISYDPIRLVEPPAVKKKRRKYILPEDLYGFIEDIRRSKNFVPITLAIMTGLRRAEILALRWRDVDLETRTLSVRQTLVETGSGELHVKPPKSENSRRQVALAGMTVEMLTEHRRKQAKRILMIGADYRRDLDLVCSAAAGDFIRPSRLTTGYREIARSRGFAGVSFHDLRHSHATALLEAGVDLKVVSERLGHSTITLTADTYSHVTERLDRDAAERLENYLDRKHAK